MPLNNSGPLSFGGSTVGQSINLELGLSATATASINSTAFRTLAGVPSGQISVSNFYGKSSERFYVSFLFQDGSNEVSEDFSITAAPNGRAALYMRQTRSGTNYGLTISLSDTPTISWQNWQSTPNANGTMQAVTADAAGNIYTTLTAFDSGLGTDRLGWITRFNTSGTATYLTRLTSFVGVALIYSPSNDRLIWFGSDGLNSCGIAILNTSGGIISSFRYLDQNIAQIGRGAAVDASGNIYFVGTRSSGKKRLVKLNSAGAAQFAILGTSSTDFQDELLHADSSGNIYVAATASTLIKFNSSGASVQQWRFTSGGSTVGAQAVATDSANNIYVAVSGFSAIIYLKFNSSGTLQFQRNITSSFGVGTLRGIVMSGNGAVFITGRSSATTNYVFRLSTDGSGIGTYSVGGGSVTISAGSLVVLSGTQTFTTETPSVPSFTITPNAGTTPTYNAAGTTISATSI